MKATKDGFVCKVSKEESKMINENVGSKLNFNNGDCIEVVKRFCYFGGFGFTDESEMCLG